MDFRTVSEEVPAGADTSSPGFTTIAQDIPQQSWGEVLGGVLPRAGLKGVIEPVGGLLNGVGDLIHSDTLSDLGADVARTARGAAADSSLGMSTAQSIVSTGLESAAELAPAVSPAGVFPKLGMGLAAAQQGTSRYAELRDEDFGGGSSALHAAIDGIAAGLGPAIGLPVLAQTTRPWLNRLVHFIGRDLVGQEAATAIQMGNALLSDRPDMTWGDFLDAIKTTALVTPVAAAASGAAGMMRFRDASPQVPKPDLREAPAAVAPAPTAEAVAPPKLEPTGITAPPEDLKAQTPPEAPAPTEDKVTEQGLPKGWKKLNDSPEAYELHDPTTGDHWVVGQLPEGKWQIIDPAGAEHPFEASSRADAIEAVENFKKGFDNPPRNLMPDTPPPDVPPDSSGYGSMLELTPQKMREKGQYDPELYDHTWAGTGTQLTVTRTPEGRWTVLDHEGGVGKDFDRGKGRTFDTAQHAIDFLAGVTGIDIRTDPKALEELHTDSVLSRVMLKPESILDVHPDVEKYYGGNLGDIAARAEARQQKIGEETPFSDAKIGRGNWMLPADRLGIQEAYQKVGGGGVEQGVRGPRAGAKAVLEEVTKNKGTYVATEMLNPHMQRIAAVIERLRREFLPNATILLRHMPVGSPPGRNGAMAILRPGLYDITIGGMRRGEKSASDMGRLLQYAAHEFTHAVVVHHFYEAAPAVRSNLMRSWLNYTRDVHSSSDFQQYMMEHHLLPRGFEGQEVGGPDRTPWGKYAMGFSEYLADQGSHYFMERAAPHDPVVHGWLSALVAKLQGLWTKLNSSGFIKNPDIASWLNGLAGKVAPTDRAPKSAKEPGLTAGDVAERARKRKPTPIVDTVQASALLKKAGKLMDELFRAGAQKEEVDALSPTGLIADLDWNSARALADKYGVQPWMYDEHPRLGSIDDTTTFRENLQLMNRSLSDADSRESIGRVTEAVKNFNWILQKTMTAVQLRKRYGDVVPGVKGFVDNLEKMFSYRSRWKEQADDRIKEMKATPRHEREKVFEALLDEDRTGKFLSKLGQNVAGKRTFELPVDAIKQYGLTEKGIDLYQKIRGDFDDALQEMELRATQELERIYQGNPSITKYLAEMHDSFAQMRARPYMPHTRFGDHTITVRDKNGVTREFYRFETELDARRNEARIRREQPEMKISRGKLTDSFKALDGFPPELARAMQARLRLSPDQISEFQDILKDMSAGESFVRRFQRRKDTAGWQDDVDNVPRAYADYMTKFANHASRLAYNPQLGEAISQVRGQAVDTAKRGENTAQLNELTNWLSKLHDYINDPGVEYTNLRAAATIWYLGFMPRSALVNSMSVPMVTAPYLASRFGWTKAMAAITQAYNDVIRQYVRSQALTDDERKMLADHRAGGRIDASFASELAGLREGGRLSDMTAMTKLASAGFKLKYHALWAFQKIEVLNREVTGLAMYRLAREQKNFVADDPHGYDKKAFELAGRAIQDTQAENAQWNRAEFARGRKSILFMFMTYNQNVIYQMFGGDQSWMRMLAVQLGVAGLMGAPFMQNADDLTKFLARHVFGSDINFEKAIRAYLKDSGVHADWLIHGAANDAFGVDLSGSLGLGRIIPGTDALATEGTFADRIANAASSVGGAGSAVVMNMLKALSSNDPSVLHRFNHAIPEFARALAEGGDMLTSGKAVDSKGRLLTNVSSGEAYLRMLGFQLADVSDVREKRFAQADTAQYWLSRRAYVLAIWDKAMETRDTEWRTKANEATRAFNDEAPDRSLRITASQLRASVQAHAQSRAYVERGIGPRKNTVETFQRVGQLYQ